ncbi:MAG: Lrp/AsnC family transcriptional regulator [Thermodesulforhabdaceae bacterium]
MGSVSTESIEKLDRLLLNRLQQSFPLIAEPFRRIGEELGIKTEEVIERIDNLKRRRILRQISAIFNTGALGYQTSLIAVAVPENFIDRAVQIINAYPGVSHNYLRPSADFNIWFTIAVPPGQNMETIVKGLVDQAGGFPFIILPAIRKYKLAMVLDMVDEGEGETTSGSTLTYSIANGSAQPATLSSMHIRIIRCVQEDLPVIERPFRLLSEKLGIKEADLIEILNQWLKRGIIRRFAAILNHREAGFMANGMVVWFCPEDRIDIAGRRLASFTEVSHCYHRPSHPRWPYNLYAMIHGRTVEKCHQIARILADAIDNHDYRVLFSEKEFKKIRLKLFWDYEETGEKI